MRMIISAILLAAFSLSLATVPAEARTTPGNITLRVTAKCASPGDMVKSFWVWTPEKGKIYGVPGGKSTSVYFGTFNKNVWGNTYFNWGLDCLIGADAQRQKIYGGDPFSTNYSYYIESYNRNVTNP